DPDAEARVSVRLEAVPGERVDERPAALGVGAFGAGEELRGRRCAEDLGGEPLEEVADPAGAEELAPFDAVDGHRVAGGEGDPEVGPDDLRQRADHGPGAGGPVDGRVRSAGDCGDVVVLDDERLRVGGEDGAELAGTGRVEGGAGRVLA